MGRLTNLMKGMTALGDDMGLLTGQSEAEAEGFETDGAVSLFVLLGVVGDDGERSDVHGRVWVGSYRVGDGAAGVGSPGGGGGRGTGWPRAEDGVEGAEGGLGRGRDRSEAGVEIGGAGGGLGNLERGLIG
jgi:hypothetical protein